MSVDICVLPDELHPVIYSFKLPPDPKFGALVFFMNQSGTILWSFHAQIRIDLAEGDLGFCLLTVFQQCEHDPDAVRVT